VYRPSKDHGRSSRSETARSRFCEPACVAAAPGFRETLRAPEKRQFEDGGAITVPVRVAFGSRDRVLLPGVARGRDQLPDRTRWVTLPGCGHVPMFDEPGPWSRCCSPPPTRQPAAASAIRSASKHALRPRPGGHRPRVAQILDGGPRNLCKAVRWRHPQQRPGRTVESRPPFPGPFRSPCRVARSCSRRPGRTEAPGDWGPPVAVSARGWLDGYRRENPESWSAAPSASNEHRR
jgi:hypothetical protein